MEVEFLLKGLVEGRLYLCWDRGLRFWVAEAVQVLLWDLGVGQLPEQLVEYSRVYLEV